MARKQLVAVSERAVVQRINRKLLEAGEQLKKARGGRAQADVGDYYILDVDHNCVARADVDLATLAKELGCLAAWEKLAVEESE